MATPVFVGKVCDTLVTGLSSPSRVSVPLTGSIAKSTSTTINSILVWWFVDTGSGFPAGSSPQDDAAYDNTVWGTRWAPYSQSAGGSGFALPNGRPNFYIARRNPTFAGTNWQGVWSWGAIFSDLSPSNNLSVPVPSSATAVHVLAYAVTGQNWALETALFAPSTTSIQVKDSDEATHSGASGPNPISGVAAGTITSGDLIISMAEERLGAGSGDTVVITADGTMTIDDYFDIGSGRMAFAHRVATSTVTTESSAWTGPAGGASGVLFQDFAGATFLGTIPDQLAVTASYSYVDVGTDRNYTVVVTDLSGLAANTTNHKVELLYRSSPLVNYSNASVTGTGPTYAVTITVPTGTIKAFDAWLYDGVLSNNISILMPGQNYGGSRLPLLGAG